MTADRDGFTAADEVLVEDLKAVLAEPRAPAAYTRRLHEAVDAGFLVPLPRRRRWPLVAVGVAVAAAVVLAVTLVPRLFVPDTPVSTEGWQARSADGVVLPVKMTVLMVSSDGQDTDWIHAGDRVPAAGWLRFEIESPPGVHVALVRQGGDDEAPAEVFYRWPAPTGTDYAVSSDGDVWYDLGDLDGEQSFACVSSNRELDDDELRRALAGEELDQTPARVERLPVRIER